MVTIEGDHDKVVTSPEVKALVTHLGTKGPDALLKLIRLHNCGHTPQEECPDKLTTHLLDLASIVVSSKNPNECGFRKASVLFQQKAWKSSTLNNMDIDFWNVHHV